MVIQQCERDTFFQSVKSLYQSETLCDVTFRVRGRTFSAHRVVLAAANRFGYYRFSTIVGTHRDNCPYYLSFDSYSFLGAMLVSGFRESGTNVVDIDCDPVLFRYVLDYLYGVPIEVPSSLIVPLLGLASSYSMIGMRDRLADVLGQNLCIENSCAIFAAAGALCYCVQYMLVMTQNTVCTHLSY